MMFCILDAFLSPLKTRWAALPHSGRPLHWSLQQHSLLGHSASVPWEQAKGPFLCRPSSSVPRLLLFPAWLRWRRGWISCKEVVGGGEVVGDRKAFHQAGKLNKLLGYQTLADLCLYSLHFPILPHFFLLLHSCWNQVMFDQRLHLSSDLCSQRGILRSQAVGSNPTTGISPVPWNVVQNIPCFYLTDPNTWRV